ncbi:MAG: putative RDD family membrane protein YckC [Lentimonas sp.]|jgi:uncharacterized RDD family membrane protein YckC
MKEWHYAESDQTTGPISEAELIQLFESGRLPKHSLVWTEGQADWLPASEIDELTPRVTAPTHNTRLAPRREIRDSDDDFIPTGEQLRPWIRNWARGIDFILFSVGAGLAIGVIYAPALDQIPEMIFGIILLIAYLFVEPIMLMSWGTTPGKFLLSVRLRNEDGSKLSYGEGLTRSFKVLTLGQGLGIPLISLVTHILAYNRLTNRGITAWDESGNHRIAHREISAWRALVIIAIFIGSIALTLRDAQSSLQGY